MISKNRIKFIHSLEHKKNRNKEGLFVAEGPKIIDDLIAICQPELIIATEEWLESHVIDRRIETNIVTETELSKVSFLHTPQSVMALFPIPKYIVNTDCLHNNLNLVIDGVQDPGNMGTIVRIADWFGISNIVCSNDTVDVYSPKVIQATMGSILRVNIGYTDLIPFLSKVPSDYPVYGTLLDGNDIYKEKLSSSGIIIMGNEGNGISSAVRDRITRKLLIPNFPYGRETADSLNVAIATAVTCAEFRRRSL
jgi:TrmH family RNA methyltransferase